VAVPVIAPSVTSVSFESSGIQPTLPIIGDSSAADRTHGFSDVIVVSLQRAAVFAGVCKGGMQEPCRTKASVAIHIYAGK
jgi:hypothetical protein